MRVLFIYLDIIRFLIKYFAEILDSKAASPLKITTSFIRRHDKMPTDNVKGEKHHE